jgi:hypothetical protein
MSSFHSLGNGDAVELEVGAADRFDFREPLFDAERFPATAFFTERFFMRRPSNRAIHRLRAS